VHDIKHTVSVVHKSKKLTLHSGQSAVWKPGWAKARRTKTWLSADRKLAHLKVKLPAPPSNQPDRAEVDPVKPPFAAFDISRNDDGSYSFADQSFDPDGSLDLTQSWNFGDPTSGANTGNGTSVSHAFSSPGASYVVTETVQESDGQHAQVQHTVVVPKPHASFGYSQVSGATYDFTDQSTETGDTIDSYSWDFGDSASGGDNSSTDQSPEHTFSGPGQYTVTETVTDSHGVQDVLQQQITVG
jgi:PKD repeat protein